MAALLLALAGCGPGDAGNAAGNAAGTVAALAPAGSAETAQAVANDPTVEAAANEAVNAVASAVSDPGVQSTLDQAFNSINNNTVTLQQGQALGLSALSGLSDVQNYKMTITDAPAAAAASKGKVIKEASGGNISLSPDEYSKYFTTSGDYKVRLDVTSSGNKTASHEFTVTVP
jgi:hypothetical protein